MTRQHKRRFDDAPENVAEFVVYSLQTWQNGRKSDREGPSLAQIYATGTVLQFPTQLFTWYFTARTVPLRNLVTTQKRRHNRFATDHLHQTGVPSTFDKVAGVACGRPFGEGQRGVGSIYYW